MTVSDRIESGREHLTLSERADLMAAKIECQLVAHAATLERK
jgi:hypothetical protein